MHSSPLFHQPSLTTQDCQWGELDASPFWLLCFPDMSCKNYQFTEITQLIPLDLLFVYLFVTMGSDTVSWGLPRHAAVFLSWCDMHVNACSHCRSWHLHGTENGVLGGPRYGGHSHGAALSKLGISLLWKLPTWGFMCTHKPRSTCLGLWRPSPYGLGWLCWAGRL